MSGSMAGPTDEVLDRFDQRVAQVRAGGDRAVVGAAVLDRGLVYFGRGRFDEAVTDLDEAADALHGSGYQAAAAVVASVASLVARVHGDLPGAVARAQFARGWAPPASTAAVAGHVAVAEAALDAGDVGPGIWAYLEATNVLGDAGLPEPTRRGLAAYADWLSTGENLARRRRTPLLDGARAGGGMMGVLQAVLLGQAGVDHLAEARPSPDHDLLGHAVAGVGLTVTYFRAGRDQPAARAIVEAHLLGVRLPTT
jgi:hypothetical protein